MFKRFAVLLAIPLALGGLVTGAVFASPSEQQQPADFRGPIQFIGQVQEIPSSIPSSTAPTAPQPPGSTAPLGTWKIQGLRVEVTANTDIDGSPQLQSIVQVGGTISTAGVVSARSIAVIQGEIEFTGFIQSLPQAGLLGAWKVEGITVTVTAATEIEGTPQVGAFVKIEGAVGPNGEVEAKEVMVRGLRAALRQGDARRDGEIHRHPELSQGRDQDGRHSPPGLARGHSKHHEDED